MTTKVRNHKKTKPAPTKPNGNDVPERISPKAENFARLIAQGVDHVTAYQESYQTRTTADAHRLGTLLLQKQSVQELIEAYGGETRGKQADIADLDAVDAEMLASCVAISRDPKSTAAERLRAAQTYAGIRAKMSSGADDDGAEDADNAFKTALEAL